MEYDKLLKTENIYNLLKWENSLKSNPSKTDT